MKHTVRPGEDMFSIAEEYGLHSHVSIYDHPDNEELKRARPHPGVLFPGDLIEVPGRDEPKWIEIKCESRTSFRLRRYRMKVHFIDSRGDPLVESIGTMVVDGRRAAVNLEGGAADLVFLRRPKNIGIEVGAHRWTLEVGVLNPLERTEDDGISGIQARLANLGFSVGLVDGAMGPRTRACIRAFQARRGMTSTGRVDDALIEELEKAHGS